ncbi:MAG TPA: molybdopterin-guanine dinucleotide biosynthesis protein MobA [Microbacterium sp.]|nr:molybdopterin-guanine dinucleotide biosynthesis protein MobA [Microbacterium sp.]
MTACGIMLAAGAGSRYGQPKIFARDAGGVLWLERVVAAVRAGGCSEVLVVIGAEAERAREVVSALDSVSPVVAGDWADGLSASVRAGLAAAANTDADSAVIAPVDVPGMPASVVARVLEAGAGPASLARASFDGRPGHPAVIGRDHWELVAASVRGDSGANRYLATHAALAVECADLWDGADTDTR